MEMIKLFFLSPPFSLSHFKPVCFLLQHKMHGFQCRISKQGMKERNFPSGSIRKKDSSETQETALSGLTLRGEGAAPTGSDCSDLTIRRKSLHVRGKTSVRHRVSSAGGLGIEVLPEVLAGTR